MNKFLLSFAFICTLAVVSGYHYGHGGGGDDGGSNGGDHGHHEVEYHTHPHYKFEYGVKDDHTHDHHSQWESRDGDKVKGEYFLDEADGTKRVVEYSGDHHSGWQPHVKRIGHAKHPHGTSYANIHQHY